MIDETFCGMIRVRFRYDYSKNKNVIYLKDIIVSGDLIVVLCRFDVFDRYV